ncbi:MAG: hypothetical protein SVV80_08555 [Planctomycetota bacterium]|nr:hypothetical protein [Planctomycetota bacterium]
MPNEIQIIKTELDDVRSVFLETVKIIPSFNITDKKVLPYGHKPHTRSVSWIVEQVITQQAKYNARDLGLDDVDIDMPDTCLHDCMITKGEHKYYVNVKITNSETRDNKNDIAAVEKLYMQYKVNKNYRLIYACFGVIFRNITISFMLDYIHVFSPQFLPIYVNPRNDKIQAFYKHDPVSRSRREFLRLLRENSKSIVLE